ncbi:hypothetical protein ABID19_000304 [Mesorhizobium robiniae]|uniref:Uncharacterized protein n=1 Tax=Mesorhizobium robiniae TaxID=559315 RepID=A0ABV2GG69_9HYPH
MRLHVRASHRGGVRYSSFIGCYQIPMRLTPILLGLAPANGDALMLTGRHEWRCRH